MSKRQAMSGNSRINVLQANGTAQSRALMSSCKGLTKFSVKVMGFDVITVRAHTAGILLLHCLGFTKSPNRRLYEVCLILYLSAVALDLGLGLRCSASVPPTL